MGLILHLTDLHLGPGAGDTPVADLKVKGVVRPAGLKTRAQAAMETLGQIGDHLKKRNTRFSAVVISGDIAHQNHIDGYEQLSKFLKPLSACLPTDKRAVVVTPGNHDVEWKSPHSSRARYERFIKYVRDKLGATTPPLEGIDDLNDPTDRHYWCNSAEGWAIVPLNSSDYCGSWAGLYGIEDSEYDEFEKKAIADGLPNAEKIFKALNSLRTYDMARVSPDQITAFKTLSTKAARDCATGDRGTLLLATLHHQLLPVGHDEEIKPFEGITNLGEVRSMFADAKVGLVMHGHKHVGANYWDKQEAVGDPATEMLILSGPTVGGDPYTPGQGKNPCSILKVDAIPGGHSVRVLTAPDFLKNSTGSVARFFSGTRFKAAEKDERASVISAASFSEAYARLQTLPIFQEGGPRTCSNLTVQIKNGSTVEKSPPPHYPTDVVEDPSQLQSWFENVADWWQQSISELSSDLNFTHGMRIERYRNTENQLKIATNSIRKLPSEDNGRVIICLIDPETDFRRRENGRAGWFPAFAMAQFYVTNDSNDTRVNVTGFYRK